jgi:hypothetical protein
MSGPNDEQKAWVTRVLGFQGTPEATTGPDLPKALAGWQAALERLDHQIAALQSVLRDAPDDDLQRIAEFGLNAMTMNHKVRLQAALIDGGAAPDQRIAKLALTATDAFAAHLRDDPRIAACDSNPFGVAMSIQATLLPALGTLHTALASFA